MSEQPDLQSLKTLIKAEAFSLGFCLFGVTDTSPMAGYDRYVNWIQKGRHARMSYMASDYHLTMRQDPTRFSSEASSILVFGWPYQLTQPNVDETTGLIAGYAAGEDYHTLVPRKLARILELIKQHISQPFQARIVTDSAPVLERELGQRAGLGWIGKNSCLISPDTGSAFLLSEIFISLPFPIDQPFAADRCGSCTRCLQACPTSCIQADRTIDSNKCISYLTIENKESVAEDLEQKIGNWIFGCDICQIVCPWNLRSKPENEKPMTAVQIPMQELIMALNISETEFKLKYHDSPILRAKHTGFLRNLVIVLGNMKSKAALQALQELYSKSKIEWLIKTITSSLSRIDNAMDQ